MNSYNELIELLSVNNITPARLCDYEDDYSYLDEPPQVSNIASIAGPYTLVDSKGGYEGEGEEFYRVFYFEKFDVYVKVNAYYYSYDGIDFGGSKFTQVFPHTKTITVYDAKP